MYSTGIQHFFQYSIHISCYIPNLIIWCTIFCELYIHNIILICYSLVMDKNKLLAIGLSVQQADVYARLIKNGEEKPAELAKHLGLSRTNAYKILDSLVDLEIVEKSQEASTLAYRPANPLALATLSSKFRAEAVAREEAVNGLMHDLLATYSKHTNKPGVTTYFGREKVIEAYRKQINLKEDVHFIHTGADVPMMGFEVMHELRMAPSSHGNKRRSIMRAPKSGKVNYASHERSNMTPTWIESAYYTEPVEWSVTASSLLIVSYKTEPQAILVIDKIIASAFLQLFLMLESHMSKKDVHLGIESLRRN